MAKNDTSLKITSLTTYLEQMKNRLAGETGPLLEWVKLEIRRAETKLEALRMK